MARIVLFGGTFNPFHVGHYRMLSVLNGLPEVDRVFLMPDRIPPHKQCDFLAPDEDRIEMCRRIAEDFDRVELCLIEFERPGKSYTYDTVQALKKRYLDDDFFMACGGDMITSLETWYRYPDLIGEIGFYAFRRVGTEDFDQKVRQLKNSGVQMIVLEDPVPAVSSTELRLALARGEHIPLLPKTIEEYIRERNLYDGKSNSRISGV